MTPAHRFTPRTGVPCPLCPRWLDSWVMLGIHVSGHKMAERVMKDDRALLAEKKKEREDGL